MSDETPAEARRRRRRASTPAVDLTDPDTVTLGEYRRLRSGDYPASSSDDTTTSERAPRRETAAGAGSHTPPRRDTPRRPGGQSHQP